MNIPCRIKALKHTSYGGKLIMEPGMYADVTVEKEKNSNVHRIVKVTSRNSSLIFTEAALEYAIERGDFCVY